MKFKLFLMLMMIAPVSFGAETGVEDIPVIPPTTVVVPPVTPVPPTPPVTPPVTPDPGVIVIPTPTPGTNPGGVTVTDPTGGTIVVEPENPDDSSFHQEEAFVFFSTGNKGLRKGYYGFNKKGKLSDVERNIHINGTVVLAACGLNKKERKGDEYLVINGVVSSTPLCTYNKSKLAYNKFISQTLYKGDKIAIWTKNSTAKKHKVILKMYKSNLGE